MTIIVTIIKETTLLETVESLTSLAGRVLQLIVWVNGANGVRALKPVVMEPKQKVIRPQ